MFIILLLLLIAFIVLNIFAFNIFKEKSKSFRNIEIKENTKVLFIWWAILILINGIIIVIPPLMDMIFKTTLDQTLIDNLATLGFASFFIFVIIIYVYILKFKQSINLTHSLGFVAVYAIEISFFFATSLYYLIVSI